jgi:hypothetical protein
MWCYDHSNRHDAQGLVMYARTLGKKSGLEQQEEDVKPRAVPGDDAAMNDTE